jgi:alpha-D-ribose 1-methylphosphonate 5-triphosphate synthase subunit PhnG
LGVKTAEAGTTAVAAAAGGGALCFLLCSIQMTMGDSSIQLKNISHFSF